MQLVSSSQDQARLIAERVAQRIAGDSARESSSSPTTREMVNGGEQRRARIVNFVSSDAPPRTQPSIGVSDPAQPEMHRAPSVAAREPSETFFYPQVVQSPWLAPFANTLPTSSNAISNPPSASRNSQLPNHPSEERFGVEEAAVSELVEFFEAEKQCTVDPSGKPCDHCAMCSSRGF